MKAVTNDIHKPSVIHPANVPKLQITTYQSKPLADLHNKNTGLRLWESMSPRNKTFLGRFDWFRFLLSEADSVFRQIFAMIGSKFFTLIGSEFSFVSIFLRFAAQNCTVMGHSAYNKFYLLKMLEGAKLSAVVLLDNILVTSFDKRRPLFY